ncbi:MAG TPA: 3-oxoadipyl-CoA thiolase [Actinomycetales bacterium]|jgi:3-oxoadipyl-CoA thiolase|nr:3-oxoadipyl-CoA thiolase [Actinomycetales bacterium]
MTNLDPRAPYLVTGVRTPIGRYGGALASVRPDDMAALVLRTVVERMQALASGDAAVDEVVMGCANQAGEDNRNVARMAVLLAGLPQEVPGRTVNRLCASGLDAVADAARQVRSGEADVMLAGGVESMSRAPFVLGKADKAFDRNAEIFDTTIGWRFVNPALAKQYGTDSMPETAENVADDHGVSREDQDAYALRSQQRTAAAQSSGLLAEEIVPVPVPQRRGDPVLVDRDEHPRETSLEALARLRPIVRPDGTITAGNASGVNDGAAAVLVASGDACDRFGWQPLARIDGAAAAGVAPRTMGVGPVPATQKLLGRAGIGVDDLDVVELNEAFAAQVLASLRQLGIKDDADHVNPNGGAIALGHPLGMSGARLALAAAMQLRRVGGARALATMCVGVGQGAAMLLSDPTTPAVRTTPQS